VYCRVKSLNTNDLGDTFTNTQPQQCVLFEAELSSSLNDLVNQALEISNRSPHILPEIENDLDIHGLKKKAGRDADRRYFADRNPSFDSMADLRSQDVCSRELEQGHPRMPAIVVFVLLLVRGWIGGPKSANFQLVLCESISLRRFFEAHNFQVPGASTVADNINAVREQTLKHILGCQLDYAKANELDTFEDFIADSTAVSANSKYPTDSGLLGVLAIRMTGLFDRLKKLKFGFPDWTRRALARKSKEVAEEIELHAKRIGMLSGKRNVQTHRKALYAKIYTRVGRLVRVFTPILATVSKAVAKFPLPPSKAKAVQRLIQQSQEDLRSIARISLYSRRRIFREQSVAASEKVLSISDKDAAIIKKGGWDNVFGYRPQLGFSGKGLITAHCLPRGNAADSGQLPNLLEANERNTGVVPKRVSLDDGYTNGKVRKAYLARREGEVEVFSFAGSKGRQVIGEETYDSEAYKKARSDRSAAESRIFTLKFNHGYEDLMRRGHEAVKHEQLTKVLSYNIRRLVWLRAEKARAQRDVRLKKAA
jgi:hypothetical protein